MGYPTFDRDDDEAPRLDRADNHDILSEAATRLRRLSRDPDCKLAELLTTVAQTEAAPGVLDEVVILAEQLALRSEFLSSGVAVSDFGNEILRLLAAP